MARFMPNTFTINILNKNNGSYYFLNDVNYGIPKPQFHHYSKISKCICQQNDI